MCAVISSELLLLTKAIFPPQLILRGDARVLAMSSKRVVVEAAVSAKWANGEPLYLSYARRFELVGPREPPSKIDRIARKLCQLYIRILGAYFCNLDLEASQTHWRSSRPCSRASASLVPRRWRRLEQSRWKQRLHFGWLYWAIASWYLGSLAFLSLYSYHQYLYDIDVLRLQALDKGLELHKLIATPLPPPVIRSSIVAHMNASRRVLDMLGSDFAHLTFLVEAALVLLIVMTTIITLPVALHHTFQRPFDQYHLVRDLLDCERENDTLRRMAERQATQFLASSREFYRNAIYFHATDTSTEQQHAESSSHVGLALRRERQTRHLVREMLSTGALTPLFKLQPGARWRVRALCALFLMITEGVLVVYVGILFFYFAQAKPAIASQHPSWHLLAACFGPLAFVAFTVIVHPPVAIVVTQEQIQYVQHLRRMISHCIELNCSALFAGLHSQDQHRLERLEHTLNSNLLFVLLHYKIFVAQLRPLTLSLGVSSNTWLALMLAWPALTRLHQPYLIRLNINWLSVDLVKIYAMLVSVALVGEAIAVGGPLCYLNSRCQTLYRDLASLAAHLSEARLLLVAPSLPDGAAIYDTHAESCLLLELADSQRFLQPLTVTAWGISTTHGTFLRALFWYGIAVISILSVENACPNEAAVVSAFFADPLGVYSHIECT